MTRAVLILIFVLAPGVASAQSPQTTAPQIPRTVPEMWEAWCARCHAKDGTGKVAVPTVKVEPMDFTRCRITTSEPDADWALAIRQGGPAVGLSSDMPAFGDVLTPGQVRAFVELIRGFCKEPGWPSGNFNLPRPVFTEKAFPEDELVLLPAVSHKQDERAAASFKVVYEQRIGRRAQLEAVFPIESVAGPPRETGKGDLELGLKYALTPRARTHLVTAGFDVVIPTGNSAQGLGEGTAVFEPYLAAAVVSGGTYVQGQFKIEMPRHDPWKDRATIYRMYVCTSAGIRASFQTRGRSASSSTARTAGSASRRRCARASRAPARWRARSACGCRSTSARSRASNGWAISYGSFSNRFGRGASGLGVVLRSDGVCSRARFVVWRVWLVGRGGRDHRGCRHDEGGGAEADPRDD